MRDALRQIVALDQFHDERVGPTAVFEPVDGADVGMVQRGEDLRFALKRASRSESSANASGRILRATSRFSFVSRARYTSPMPPAPRAESDLVRAEAGAGGEGQGFL